MVSLRITTIFAFLFAWLCNSSSGQHLPSSGRVIVAVRTTEPIRVDGRLTESVWQRTAEEGFVQREPDEGAPSSQRTQAWVAYDAEALYVAMRLSDAHPDSVVGLCAKREWIYDHWGDVFMVDDDMICPPDLFLKLYYQVNSAIDKMSVQLLFVYRFQPPFGLVQFAYQRGSTVFGVAGERTDTLFMKIACMF